MHPRLHAAAHPDKPAAILAETGETLTYAQLEATANRAAHLFRKLGIVPGDTVAAWLPNTLRYFEIFWAAQRAGLYITPVSTRLTADEAAYIVADCGAKLLLTSDAIGAIAAFMEGPRADCPALATVLWADTPVAGADSWSAAIAPYPASPIADETAGRYMCYSSGTTGRPKGIRVALEGGPAIGPNPIAERMQRLYGGTAATVYLSPAPFYHAAPLAFSTAVQRLGGTVVMLDHFTPEGTLAAIERYRVTCTQMVPTMFLRLLRLSAEERAAHDLSSLTCVMHAAAPCPIEVKRGMIDWLGPIIHEYYSSSESNGTTTTTSQQWLERPGSVGRVDTGVLHICGEDGIELPAGSAGTIYFEGAGEPFEYWNDPEKTAESRHPTQPGWSTIGDIGYVDAAGYLYLTDRKSFMIISGGVNIYPQEVENLLAVHPKVGDVAVFGVPNDEMGEEVKAVVQPRDWSDAGPALAEELIGYCRQRLSGLKCPRSIDFDPALPRHETGKLYKRVIRDRYWQGHATRIV
ncbi:acyl-CoA synthetase [Sphingomonas immobilis]|uniref:Acyl-CoA synthetase n=1 Tax=Sphingomonas immobilis TaxID=3063997 RepID=A0ABT9A0K4_9SPHN|nr:acyl-CoA synthetase [Sphingomonas sp. CA1-15]MDO7842227.1 acyl-CoA synthetase [Sphingomonas sp. CA1-15]